MKRFLIFIAAVFTLTATLRAQTAQEIVDKMDQVMADVNPDDGMTMVMEMKMPIIGTVATHVLSLGDKMRMDIGKGKDVLITWEDAFTEWTYDAEKNQITIKNRAADATSEADENMKMFDGITAGYDVSIRKETPTEWHIRCKKNRNNKEKDDPKTMDLVVEKGTYMPLSLSAKVSMVTVTMRNLAFGTVTEKDVTFDPAAYPTAKVVDER